MTEIELIVDSYEQPIPRPSEYEQQRHYYSGKKKQHTKKGQIVTVPSGRDIVDVAVGEPGKKSDINLFREHQEKFLKSQKFSGDKGYVGEAAIKTPQKKPKGKKLTLEEKESNQQLARTRIVVEHLIRLLKIFRVASERFRLNSEKYESVILLVCGLVRLRIGAINF